MVASGRAGAVTVPIANLVPGALAYTVEHVDTDTRYVFYRREADDRPVDHIITQHGYDTSHLVRTTRFGLVQHRGKPIDDHTTIVRGNWRGALPWWTDGRFQVQPFDPAEESEPASIYRTMMAITA